jgi:hypothetical protein
MSSDDPSIQWQQATPWAILVDEKRDYWEAGRINDVIVAWSGATIVAADSGGVWAISSDGASATPLGDGWDNPDTRCVRFGPDGDDHVFAGGGALHVTDTSAPVPLFNWKQINSIALKDPGEIHSIAILKSPRRIVVACDSGLLWSEIPPAGPKPVGCLAALLGASSPGWTDKFSWKRARDGDGTFSGAMFSVAIGSSNRDQRGEPTRLLGTTVVAGAKGDGSRGLYVGGWDSGELTMRRAHLAGAGDLAQLEMAAVSVDACRFSPSRLYAACSDRDGRLMVVLRSDDGGATWNECGTKLTGGAKGNLLKNAGGQGDEGWSNCIGASPFARDLVALGWQWGPFVSDDGGQTWYQAEGGNHADHHATYWDPRMALTLDGVSGERLYVCSDGGIVCTDDRGKTFDGRLSKHLQTMQCYSADGARESWGSVGAGAAMVGAVAAGTQDNGNLYATVHSTPGPFVHLDGGDGGFNCLLGTGWILHDIGLQPEPQPVNASRWDPASRTFVGQRTPPINGPKPGAAKDPKGLKSVHSLEAVQHPAMKSGGAFIQAVASVGGDLYGLFGGVDGTDTEWRYIGSVPGEAWSIASIDGSSVFVGTNDRRIFNLDPATATAAEYRYDPSLNEKGTIFRIVTFANDRAFAIQNRDTEGDVIALRAGVWTQARSGIPIDEGPFWGLDQSRHIDSQTLVATTDAHVWISYDEAKSWARASAGLPARPHCSDIRFAQEPDGSQRLYLGTYGRSLWSANLFPDSRGTVHAPPSRRLG